APHSCALVSALALRALARDQRRARERAAAAGVKLTGDIASPARRLNPTIRRARAVSASTCSSPARAAKAATAIIPIVFETGGGPVALGLVGSLSRPSGNITGVTSLNVEVGPKRFELMRQLTPTATAVVLLVNPRSPTTQAVIAESREAARALKFELHL